MRPTATARAGSLWSVREPPPPNATPGVNVVVVAYNSGDQLRACVEPLAGADGIRMIVVNNASPDGGLETIADLDVSTIQSGVNGGFSFGCNIGWRAGAAPAVLFLNPDARIDADSVRRLARTLVDDPTLGIAGPLIRDADGSLDFSQRHFPRLSSTYAQALFLHRVAPGARWADQLIRRPEAYARPGRPDWVSGACLMIRRRVLEEAQGLDERFFLYSEDVDLCRRVRDLGYDIAFEPAVVCRHEGGASAPRAGLYAVLAESRMIYARAHRGRLRAATERIGIGLGELTHAALGRGGAEARRGHRRALARVIRGPRSRGGPP